MVSFKNKKNISFKKNIQTSSNFIKNKKQQNSFIRQGKNKKQQNLSIVQGTKQQNSSVQGNNIKQQPFVLEEKTNLLPFPTLISFEEFLIMNNVKKKDNDVDSFDFKFYFKKRRRSFFKVKKKRYPKKFQFTVSYIYFDKYLKPSIESFKKPSKESFKKPFKEFSKKPFKEFSKKISKEASKKISNESSKKISKESPKKISNESSKKISKKSSKKISKESSKKISKKSSKKISKESSKKISKKSSKKISKKLKISKAISKIKLILENNFFIKHRLEALNRKLKLKNDRLAKKHKIKNSFYKEVKEVKKLILKGEKPLSRQKKEKLINLLKFKFQLAKQKLKRGKNFSFKLKKYYKKFSLNKFSKVFKLRRKFLKKKLKTFRERKFFRFALKLKNLQLKNIPNLKLRKLRRKKKPNKMFLIRRKLYKGINVTLPNGKLLSSKQYRKKILAIRKANFFNTKKFKFFLFITVSRNNIFFNLSRVGIKLVKRAGKKFLKKSSKTIKFWSAGLFDITCSKKKRKYALTDMFPIIKQKLNSVKIFATIIKAPAFLNKHIFWQLRNNRFRIANIIYESFRIFNGCRSKKKRRKKHLKYRVLR